MGDVFVFILIVVVTGLAGLTLGIVFLAPRLSRLANRPDEDADDRAD